MTSHSHADRQARTRTTLHWLMHENRKRAAWWSKNTTDAFCPQDEQHDVDVSSLPKKMAAEQVSRAGPARWAGAWPAWRAPAERHFELRYQNLSNDSSLFNSKSLIHFRFCRLRRTRPMNHVAVHPVHGAWQINVNIFALLLACLFGWVTIWLMIVGFLSYGLQGIQFEFIKF